MKWGWDWTCSMRLECRILGVMPILCIARFKRREKWISLYQIESICLSIYTSCKPCAQVHEVPQSHCGHNREGTLFSVLHKYILHPSCFFEIWALCVSWVTPDHLYKCIYTLNKYIYRHTNTHTQIYIYREREIDR